MPGSLSFSPVYLWINSNSSIMLDLLVVSCCPRASKPYWPAGQRMGSYIPGMSCGSRGWLLACQRLLAAVIGPCSTVSRILRGRPLYYCLNPQDLEPSVPLEDRTNIPSIWFANHPLSIPTNKQIFIWYSISFKLPVMQSGNLYWQLRKLHPAAEQ